MNHPGGAPGGHAVSAALPSARSPVLIVPREKAHQLQHRVVKDSKGWNDLTRVGQYWVML
jgi:hypothetical protein